MFSVCGARGGDQQPEATGGHLRQQLGSLLRAAQSSPDEQRPELPPQVWLPTSPTTVLHPATCSMKII